jgi:hypothetical protein
MLEDIGILTGGQVISEKDLGIKLENVTLNMLGKARGCSSKENSTIVEAPARGRNRRPLQPDPRAGRDHLGLRPRLQGGWRSWPAASRLSVGAPRRSR